MHRVAREVRQLKKKVTIAAVGDILMWKSQIAAAQIPGTRQFSFAEQFAPVAGLLQRADFTIGNLETTFSGPKQPYQIGSFRAGYPRFNCPDELARDLKHAGFQLLTTANNHCLDGGPLGLGRTLDVLDRYQLDHTGTYRNKLEAQLPYIKLVKGIRIGVLAYTYGTNKQKIPANAPWMVNLLHPARMEADIVKLRPLVDILIVSLHFGIEFRYTPTLRQRILVQALLDRGADIVLGAHPHVLQPVVTPMIRQKNNQHRKTVVAYSLGNFSSEPMLKIQQSQCGAILFLTIEKEENRQAELTQISVVPTYTLRFTRKGRIAYRIVPLRTLLHKPSPYFLRAWGRVREIIGKRFL
ncbi:CapA family protein [Brevibacillus panacihumi]|uniref:CapA family protein n=1 Tax=Brevibacillus panacihumi TaxID=497735 RepID=UPI00040E311F